MIFLNILKIIGIILVVILAVLLALILLVLFCPIKYRIFGTEVYDKKNKSNIHIRLSWLFHLIGLNVSIDPELSVWLRILFVKKNLIKDSDTSDDNENDGSDNDSSSDNYCRDANDIENAQNMVKNDDNVETSKNKAGTAKIEKTVSEAENDSSDNKDISDNKDENKTSDSDDLYGSDDLSDDQSEAEKDIKKEKIKRLTAQIKKILKDGSCKEAIEKIKTELIKLLKAVMPYRLYLRAEFSAGSPDKTGMALGVLAMFPIGYKNKWKIVPDFEREELYIDSEFDIKGRIFLYKILVIAIRLLVDKNCRKLYNEIRK